jgi:pimeloyl-ACP methyl ester carboxylesterase
LLEPLARSLGRNFQVFGLSLRGEQDCFELRQGCTADSLAQDVCHFLNYLNLERPLLMGVSFGGVLALHAASRWPHRFGGLVVQGAEVRFEPTLLRRVAGEILRGYPLPTNSSFVNQFFNLLFGCKPRDRQLFEFVTRTCWATDQSVMASRFQIAEELDLGDRLECIRTPTLLLHGGRDLLVSRKGLAEMVSAIPETELIELPQAGHLAFVTHPNELAESVERFAQDVGLLETAVAVT